MSLFLTMLPLYLLGNLHCIGMCGPLVMMIGQHRYRYYYFAGRTLSFALAGLLAGSLGAVCNQVLALYHLSAYVSFLFGGIIIVAGITQLLHMPYPGYRWLTARFGGLSRRLAHLMSSDQPWATFLFGLCTILLPCGQTLIVYSACALSGDPLVGFGNGAAFAVLTSPSLILAMHAHGMLGRLRKHYNLGIGICALVVGTLAVCRGLADLDVIPHVVINPAYHIVLY